MSETGLLPAYLIVGTDGVKRDHAVSRMKARLEKSGMVEFNLDERDMTKDPDIESIIGSLNTFPMGSEFRLVILDGCSKLAKAVSEPLVEYLASPSPTTVCLIIADSLAKNTRLYKAIAKIDKTIITRSSNPFPSRSSSSLLGPHHIACEPRFAKKTIADDNAKAVV